MPARKTTSKFRRNIFLTLAFLGPLFVILGLYTFFYQKTILSFNRVPEAANAAEKKSKAVKVEIGDINVNLPIEETQIIDGVWEISGKTASHLNNSANPDENGNIVIYGHNKKKILGSLPYVRIGTKVALSTQDGKVHNYEIVKKETVKPNNLTYVLPTDYEVLTIYTCTGFLDTTRFVIQAKPI